MRIRYARTIQQGGNDQVGRRQRRPQQTKLRPGQLGEGNPGQRVWNERQPRGGISKQPPAQHAGRGNVEHDGQRLQNDKARESQLSGREGGSRARKLTRQKLQGDWQAEQQTDCGVKLSSGMKRPGIAALHALEPNRQSQQRQSRTAQTQPVETVNHIQLQQ